MPLLLPIRRLATRHGLAPITSLALLLSLSNAVQGEGFGRWDTTVRDCTLLHGVVELPLQAQRQTCQRLRLEQNMEGLLSVRLIQPSANQRFGSQSLVFGGVLAERQQTMRCNTNGECQPRWPIRLQVATVANNLVNGPGVAPTLPMAQLARGSCVLERRILRCQARDQNGRFWEAKAWISGARTEPSAGRGSRSGAHQHRSSNQELIQTFRTSLVPSETSGSDQNITGTRLLRVL